MARKINRKIVDFDEAISDSITKEFGLKELPLKSRVFTAVLLVVGLLIGGAAVRVLILGGLDYGHYLTLASGNVNKETRSVAPRGLITDRYGKQLVANKPVFNARLQIPVMIKNGEEDMVLNTSTTLLGLQREDVVKLISKTNIEIYPDIILSRDIGTKAAIDLKSLDLQSIYIENGYKRQYASISLAHVLGFVGFSDVDNSFKGRTGLEAYYDGVLRGQDGQTITYKNARGETQGTEMVSEPKQGDEFKTTIDFDLQEYFYKSMLKGLNSIGKTSGVGIAINPLTGEVLSLISLPAFDPNNLSAPLSGANKPFFNRAVSGVYNPGSTIKPIHAAAILKENIVS
ncbi:MAG: penicillin-binding transpeptidase domain-containing protein, partial [Patescibacteria group bacterium]